jgi:NurA-like 5'-3' nuclease
MIPPVGAVTYLVRFHANTPVLRFDLDRQFWEQTVQSNPVREAEMFSELDYSGHDYRSYGYPYPIKACHDRVRLSIAERSALKKQIIEAAVARGMKRSLFRDVSSSTGHV